MDARKQLARRTGGQVDEITEKIIGSDSSEFRINIKVKQVGRIIENQKTIQSEVNT